MISTPPESIGLFLDFLCLPGPGSRVPCSRPLSPVSRHRRVFLRVAVTGVMVSKCCGSLERCHS